MEENNKEGKKEFVMISRLDDNAPKSYTIKLRKEEPLVKEIKPTTIKDQEKHKKSNDIEEERKIDNFKYLFRILKRQKGGKQKGREKELEDFSKGLKILQKRIGEKRKVSVRGWCYLLEGFTLITKDKFKQGEKIINECRKKGYLPIDFVLADQTRQFYFVDDLEMKTEAPYDYLKRRLEEFKDNIVTEKDDILFWEDSKIYLQMMVEKIDLLHLFSGVCKACHIPIASVKGWSDILSRYELAIRFKKAEEKGMKPVLLYYSDHDPAGIYIVNTIKKNLEDISLATEWHTDNLKIDRVGLKEGFIDQCEIAWIYNLTTGSGRNLGELYKRYKERDKEAKIYEYEIRYIEKYGIRKCEANAILPYPREATFDLAQQILKYIPKEKFDNYKEKITKMHENITNIQISVDFDDIIEDLMKSIDDEKNE